jgi:exopolysaccharide biosynthesis polyprenyl glycosylphosphotransferase
MAGNPPTTASIVEQTVETPVLSIRSQRLHTLLAISLPFIDSLMLALAFVTGYEARAILPFFPRPAEQPSIWLYLPILAIQIVTVITMFYFSRLYHQRRSFSRIDQMRTMVGIITLAALLTNGMQELFFRNSLLDIPYPRSLFFYVWFFSIVFAIIGREFHRFVQARFRRRRAIADNLLIVGTGKIAREMVGHIKNSPELGYNIIGVVTDKDEHQGRMLGIPVLGNFPDLADIIDRCHIQQVIIALPDAKRSDLVDLITMCRRGQVDIKVYPDIFAYMQGDLNVDELGGVPLITVRDIALRGWKLSLKRGLDIFGSMTGLIFLSPLFLLTAFIMKLESKGEVFFTQQRIGLDGRPFPMIKFRSMREDAEAGGPAWTVRDDPRVTRFGKFMRRTSWDEIPQLINVLMGHMSLVGPRPEQPAYVEQFRQKYARYMERHREMVGMTGWAQIHGLRGDSSIADRTDYDLWYVENWSLWLDIKIILRTVYQTIFRKSENAY